MISSAALGRLRLKSARAAKREWPPLLEPPGGDHYHEPPLVVSRAPGKRFSRIRGPGDIENYFVGYAV
jgi:hypothetical protein